MKEVFSPDFESYRKHVWEAINGFEHAGTKVGPGERNVVKRIESGGLLLNIKAFKKPNAFNRMAYRYFRKSKARRSFEYAHQLLSLGIGTPAPVAYMESDGPLFGESYYVSEHIDEDLIFRTLIENPDYPDREIILRQFTHFTHRMHENGVLFLDHSPGNTLVKKKGKNQYAFYLVDLNRMRMQVKMDMEKRLRNFARLSATESMIRIMSDEYASITGVSCERVYEKMLRHTMANHQRRARQKTKHKVLGKKKQ
ncbi:MAG: lipopolysaccharide kinase InaA family protein [Bacteroidales bacterium]